MPKPTTYPKALVILHWLMALLFIAMIASGIIWGQGLVPDEMKGFYMGWHKAIGVSLILLITLRVGVRLLAETQKQIPELPKAIAPREAKLAKLGHMALYGLMAAVPVSGWLMVSSSPKGWPTVLWGEGESAVIWPHLPLAAELKPMLYGLMHEAHEILPYVLLGLIVLHIAGVIKHRKYDKVNLLTRMR